MEKDDNGDLCVNLCPTIDTDPVCLTTLTHLTNTLGNMTQLKVNKVAVRKDSARMEQLDDAWRDAMR